MRIAVVNNMADPLLRSGWQRIEKTYGYFPQSSYAWCATWWKHLRGKRKLYVPIVLDESDDVLGLAPLCVESYLGVKTLRSAPARYGDFYTFPTVRDSRYDQVVRRLIDHLLTYTAWDICSIGQVNSQDGLHGILKGIGWPSRTSTDCVVAALDTGDWPAYLARLGKETRRQFTKKTRRLESNHKVELLRITDPVPFLAAFDSLREMYDRRWSDDYRPERSAQYVRCLKESLTSCFEDGHGALYLLNADGKTIAYRLGFTHGTVFYDWNTSFDLEWSQYSPGHLIIGSVIRDLIGLGFTKLHFMAGRYDYKTSWAPGGDITSNHTFIVSNGRARSRLLAAYLLAWRDRLKQGYHFVLRSRLARAFSRRVLQLHQRVSHR
jgi:CelD/BcsL family acetyltransferase involved in cellulose biosynthesis